jgi:membrane-bound metal-dependent hydrolase YbcI (DUF457 family)
MASFQGHLAVSTVLGAAYGGAAAWYWQLDWGTAFLGALATTLGGMLPDLDSDSGVPVRELFSLVAAIVPVLLLRRMEQLRSLTNEQALVVLAALYLLIRYGAADIFRMITTHRGMFHSIPALLIAGLLVYLLYDSPNPMLRLYLAAGSMLGFLSHLLLDELYAVNFTGVRFRLNKYAGSAFKLYSPSLAATALTYALLFGLGFLAWMEMEAKR